MKAISMLVSIAAAALVAAQSNPHLEHPCNSPPQIPAQSMLLSRFGIQGRAVDLPRLPFGPAEGGNGDGVPGAGGGTAPPQGGLGTVGRQPRLPEGPSPHPYPSTSATSHVVDQGVPLGSKPPRGTGAMRPPVSSSGGRPPSGQEHQLPPPQPTNMAEPAAARSAPPSGLRPSGAPRDQLQPGAALDSVTRPSLGPAQKPMDPSPIQVAIHWAMLSFERAENITSSEAKTQLVEQALFNLTRITDEAVLNVISAGLLPALSDAETAVGALLQALGVNRSTPLSRDYLKAQLVLLPAHRKFDVDPTSVTGAPGHRFEVGGSSVQIMPPMADRIPPLACNDSQKVEREGNIGNASYPLRAPGIAAMLLHAPIQGIGSPYPVLARSIGIIAADKQLREPRRTQGGTIFKNQIAGDQAPQTGSGQQSVDVPPQREFLAQFTLSLDRTYSQEELRSGNLGAACLRLDRQQSRWSPKGCSVVAVVEDNIECSCVGSGRYSAVIAALPAPQVDDTAEPARNPVIDSIQHKVGDLRDRVNNRTGITREDIKQLLNTLALVGPDQARDALVLAGALAMRAPSDGNNSMFQYSQGDSVFHFQHVPADTDAMAEVDNWHVRVPRLRPALAPNGTTLCVVGKTSNPYAPLEGLASGILSVNIADADGVEVPLSGLADPVVLRLPVTSGVDALARDTEARCLYWDALVAEWSDNGCTVGQRGADFIECRCTHLTDFAISLSQNTHINVPLIAGVAAGCTALALIAIGVVVKVMKGRREGRHVSPAPDVRQVRVAQLMAATATAPPAKDAIAYV